MKAPAAIKEYNEELQRRIQYARGHTASLSEEAADAAARDTDVHLDPEAWLEADAAALSLMTEVDDRTLTMVASMWSQRYYHFDTDICRGPTGPEADRALASERLGREFHGGHGMVGVPTLAPKFCRTFNNPSDWYTAPPRPNHDSQPKASRA